ncbi:hypothetical protein B5S30_g5735 [[Candida] boidinii]|nr:hypothetical protein B5S30_g5735 [[Candida] boidinii]
MCSQLILSGNTCQCYTSIINMYDKYKHQFGGNKKFDPWEKDKQHVNGDISNRPMAKCLIGSASAARIFLQGGRLFPTMAPPKV